MSASLLDADHGRHAVVELAIRDLKEGSGLSHCASGRFGANGAWAVCATIAHNLIRWLATLGLEISGPLVAKTVRRRFLNPEQTGHKGTAMLRRYIREGSLFRENAASAVGL